MDYVHLLGGHTPFRKDHRSGLVWVGPAVRDLEEREPENHGKTWTDEAMAELKASWADGKSLRLLAASQQRKPSAVVSKLKALGVLSRDDYQSPYRVTGHGQQELVKFHQTAKEPTFSTQTYEFTTSTKEIDMTTTAPTIENRTFIDGTDATQMSDDQIVNRLVKLASACEDLEKIMPWLAEESTAREILIRRQKTLTKGIQELSAFLDKRTAEEADSAKPN